MTSAPHNQVAHRGFTLVELITILMIIGILAFTAIPRFTGNELFQERGAADQVRAALRYGQKVAVAQHGPVSVNISSASASDCGALQVVGGNVSCVVSNSVPVSAATVTFDALGRPGAAATIAVGTATITIEAETGYVH